MSWKLDDAVKTSAGTVAAGRLGSGPALVLAHGRAFWGGWYGYFADTDGHVWEVAHNPDFPIDAAGNISLPA